MSAGSLALLIALVVAGWVALGAIVALFIGAAANLLQDPRGLDEGGRP